MSNAQTTSALVGLAQRKKERTRQQIAAAAGVLMRQRGYHDTTIEEICQRADVAPRTFFRYFPTKEDLVTSFIHVAVEDVLTDLANRPATEPLHASLVAALSHAHVEHTDEAEGRALLRLVHQTPPLRARLLAQWSSWRPRLSEIVAPRINDQPDGMRSKIVASAILAALDEASRDWAMDEDSPELRALVLEALEHLTTPLLPR